MESISTLLSSVKCGRCESSLTQKANEGGFIKYKCNCSLKIRTILTCTNCKENFLNPPYLIRKTNYCSLQCYWGGTNKKQLKNCRSCGKKFYADAVLIRKGYGFYCSRGCWFSIFNEQKRNVVCRQCKKTFKVIKAVYKKKPKYCSRICKDASQMDQVFSICRGCKVEFKLTQSALNRGRGSFCSWKCFKRYRGESSLEMIIRQQLEKMDEPFQQEKAFGKFHADFYLPKRNLIIECDGEYWHMDPKIKLRDQRKDQLYQKLGYNILRLRGEDIVKKNFIILSASFILINRL